MAGRQAATSQTWIHTVHSTHIIMFVCRNRAKWLMNNWMRLSAASLKKFSWIKRMKHWYCLAALSTKITRCCVRNGDAKRHRVCTVHVEGWRQIISTHYYIAKWRKSAFVESGRLSTCLWMMIIPMTRSTHCSRGKSWKLYSIETAITSKSKSINDEFRFNNSVSKWKFNGGLPPGHLACDVKQ